MQRKITMLAGMLVVMALMSACASKPPAPVAEPTAPVATDAPVAEPTAMATDTSTNGASAVPVQTPFACPEGKTADASGALLIRGCESISDIQTKYPGINLAPNSVMMEYSAEATREGYYDSTITSGLTDLPTMCKFLQFHGDLYDGDKASLKAVGTGVDILGPICATDNEYTQVAVSDGLKKIATTALGLAADDPIFAYETSTGLGYYVFWKLDSADVSRVKVSIISGALSSK